MVFKYEEMATKETMNYIDEKTNTIMVKTYDDSGNCIIKKKRGRKSKKELEMLRKNMGAKGNMTNTKDEKIPKKRGRKPKGGKIIKSAIDDEDYYTNKIPNIILKLKCTEKDIDESSLFLTHFKYVPVVHNVNAYDNNDTTINPTTSIHYCNLEQNNTTLEKNIIVENKDVSESNIDNTKLIWDKLKNLQHKLHSNMVTDKKSNCFWCTYNFDNPPVYIPKLFINDTFEVYGCFCSPECAVAYLCNEQIDTSIKWERYSMLNNIYSKIFNYTKNIKPAPNPHYILDKYYGNLSIEEYRSLLTNDSILLVLDKPLTRVLPELHEENNDIQGFKKDEYHKEYRLSRNKPTIQQLQLNDNKWGL